MRFPGIDVFIPALAKDYEVLPYTIASLRRFLRPTPRSINLITSPAEPSLPVHLLDGTVGIISESEIGEIPPRSQLAPVVYRGTDRTGWYYQQLAKFALRRRARTPHYLVMDADTVLIRPTKVLSAPDRPVLYRGAQYHAPYFRTYEKLLGYTPAPRRSFIVDYMLLSSAWVQLLLDTIEARHAGQPWYDIVLAAINHAELSSFSEYETYGYFIADRLPGQFDSCSLKYQALPRKLLVSARWNAFRHRLRGVRSLSYHHYL